jgi:tRNA G18 (ribose-2'-O)-methylase SpoU
MVVAAAVGDSESSRRPDMYLVITNISKKNNIKKLLLTAAAFDCTGVLVVGQPTFDFETDLPVLLASGGSLPITRFDTWDACVDFLRKGQIDLVGVEIHSEAKPIEAFFNGRDKAFLMGNEGQGILEKQMKSCDAFVRIPQYGVGTASLNVYVAASIILHRFHDWQLGRDLPCESAKGSTVATL